MKKEYVKPVIESEEFVANEYVTACWTVTCTNCGAEEEGHDDLKNGVQSYESLLYSGNIYTESLNEKDPCQSYDIPNKEPSIYENFWGWILWQIFIEGLGWNPGSSGTVNYHPVEVESGWDNHPNAS